MKSAFRKLLRITPCLVSLCVSIFLLKIPPFYVIPGIEISNSLNIVRLCILFSFFMTLWIERNNQRQFNNYTKGLIIFVGVYLFGQSISIVNAVNVSTFLNVYKDIIFSLLLFFSILYLPKKNIPLLVYVFLISTVIGIVYQLTFILYAPLINIIKPFLNINYLKFVEYQTNRDRFFGDTMDESLIPILIFLLINNKKLLTRIGILMLLISIIFLVIISSWKTKFIICIYAIIASLLLFREFKKYIFKILFSFIILFILGIFLSLSLVSHNIYDRFIFDDAQTEIHIQNNRISYLKEASQIGLRYILTGSGLGNYYDNLSVASKRANKITPPNAIAKDFIGIDDPHNIIFGVFATTGSIGVIGLCLLLFYFLYSDIHLLYSEGWSKAFVITFWGYFIFAFFNPWMYFSFLVPFWFFRGIIENIKLNK